MATGVLLSTRAKIRRLRIGSDDFPTPILLPSFSSRASTDRDVRKTAERMVSAIFTSMLVSAYDIYHSRFESIMRKGKGRLFSRPYVFVDSGGYELLNLDETLSQIESEMKDVMDSEGDSNPLATELRRYAMKGWTEDQHNQVIERWPSEVRAVFATYDTPDKPAADLHEQIAVAKLIGKGRNNIGAELLLKRHGERSMPDMIEELRGCVGEIEGVSVIGITEKEAGSSLNERLGTISQLRDVIDLYDSQMPIHVFGGLDPVLTPLYHIAGADIFDGLTWLKFAFENGQANYLQASAASQFPHEDIREAQWKIRERNLTEILTMQSRMVRFASSQNYSVFGDRGDSIRLIVESAAL